MSIETEYNWSQEFTKNKWSNISYILKTEVKRKKGINVFPCHIYCESGVYVHTAFYKPWANIPGSFSEHLTYLENSSLTFEFWLPF